MHCPAHTVQTILCGYWCVCVPELYTHLTVIQDDPDFPRLTLSVSQLSWFNLSFSLSLYLFQTNILLLKAATHENKPMHIIHAHANNNKRIQAFI